MLDLRPVTLSEIARGADAAAVLVTEHGWDDLSACQFRDDLAVGLARDPSRADDPDAAKERVLSSVGGWRTTPISAGATSP